MMDVPASEDAIHTAMEDRGEMFDRLCSRLEQIQSTLSRIEDNGKPDEHDVKPIMRGDGQVTVNIRCNVIQMGDIDNVKQEFKASVYLSAWYLEPNLRGVHSDEEINWMKQWDPRICFSNSVTVDELIKKAYFQGYNDEDDCPIVRKSYRITATFKENLELRDFPFDYQELTINLMSNWPARTVKFVKDMNIKDSINTSNFTARQTWDLKPFMATRQFVRRDEAGSHRQYPQYAITCYVSRYRGYYFWNITLVLALIMGLTFSSYAVPTAETGDRLATSVTLLLTSVAFKFVVSQNLPTISYLTMLDVYVMMCLIVQVLITIQNSLSSLWSTAPTDARIFDIISAAVLVGLIVIFHIVYGIVILYRIRAMNQILNETKTNYNALCDVINEDFQKRRKNQKNNKVHPSSPKVISQCENELDNPRQGSEIHMPHPTQLKPLEPLEERAERKKNHHKKKKKKRHMDDTWNEEGANNA